MSLGYSLFKEPIAVLKVVIGKGIRKAAKKSSAIPPVNGRQNERCRCSFGCYPFRKFTKAVARLSDAVGRLLKANPDLMA